MVVHRKFCQATVITFGVMRILQTRRSYHTLLEDGRLHSGSDVATAKVLVWQNKNTVLRFLGEASTKKGQLSVTVAPMISLKRRVLELLGLVFGLVLCITTLLCSE